MIVFGSLNRGAKFSQMEITHQPRPNLTSKPLKNHLSKSKSSLLSIGGS